MRGALTTASHPRPLHDQMLERCHRRRRQKKKKKKQQQQQQRPACPTVSSFADVLALLRQTPRPMPRNRRASRPKGTVSREEKYGRVVCQNTPMT